MVMRVSLPDSAYLVVLKWTGYRRPDRLYPVEGQAPVRFDPGPVALVIDEPARAPDECDIPAGAGRDASAGYVDRIALFHYAGDPFFEPARAVPVVNYSREDSASSRLFTKCASPAILVIPLSVSMSAKEVDEVLDRLPASPRAADYSRAFRAYLDRPSPW